MYLSDPVFYNHIIYKLRDIKGAINFFSLGSRIVKYFHRRRHDQVIIERNMSCIRPFFIFVLTFPKALDSDKQDGRDYKTDIVQTYDVTRLWPSPFQPSNLSSLRDGRSTARSMSLYICDKIFITYVCVLIL